MKIQKLENDLNYLRDLTNRLEYTERFFDAYLHQAPFLIWCKENSGGELRMIFASDLYAEIVGKQEQDMLGKSDFEIWPRHIATKFVSQDRAVMEAGKPMLIGPDIAPADIEIHPEWRTTMCYKFPIISPDGRTLGVGGLAWPLMEWRDG